MTDKQPADYSLQDLSNPNLDAATLRELAIARPDLWDSIVKHPACYPELSSWIAAQMPTPVAPTTNTPVSTHETVATADTTASTVHPASTTAQPATASQQSGAPTQPTVTPTENSNGNSEIMNDLGNAAQSVGNAAQKFFTNTKHYFETDVIPKAQAATTEAKQQLDANNGKTDILGAIASFAPIIEIAGGALALISIIFLPYVNIPLVGSLTFWDVSKYAGGTSDAPLYIILAIGMIALGIAGLTIRKIGIAIGSVVVSGLAFLMSTFAVFNMMGVSSALVTVQPGIALILFILISLILLAASIIQTIRAKTPSKA